MIVFNFHKATVFQSLSEELVSMCIQSLILASDQISAAKVDIHERNLFNVSNCIYVTYFPYL